MRSHWRHCFKAPLPAAHDHKVQNPAFQPPVNEPLAWRCFEKGMSQQEVRGLRHASGTQKRPG